MKIYKIIPTSLVVLFVTGMQINSLAAGYCGDGILEESSTEQCDDGNFINRDGCDAYCQIEDMEGPEITGVSIPNGQTGVSTLTEEFIVTFSEPVDPVSINVNTLSFKQYATEQEHETSFAKDNTQLTIHFQEGLLGEKDYSIVLQNVVDALGNRNEELFVSTFLTGEFTDIFPPNVVARQPGGSYHVGQSVSLTPYVGKYTSSDEFIDEGANIYYTLDATMPSKYGLRYTRPLSIKTNTTLKYLGIDAKGNSTEVITQNYTFSCPEKKNAKEITPYPECAVLECGYGYRLQGGICAINFGDNDQDYKLSAATAPLFGSDSPMTISTKPALYVTPEHNGILPRPIKFVDLSGGTVVEFERDTKLSLEDGNPFTGYIIPPKNLYSKSFPINFGYSFKSIFNFAPASGGSIKFDPMVKITVPFSDRYDSGAKITVFTFDSNTEEYFVHDPSLVSVNETGDAVTILSDSTETFLIAQPGESYNAIVFGDTVDHWAKNYIEQLYRWEMVKGRSKGVFAPNEILTRAEFTKIALNAIGEDVDPLENVENPPFLDIPLYAWYVPYVKRAKELGWINGYPDGSFKPDSPINRVEAIKILIQAFQFDVRSIGQREDKFTDVLTWEWYFPSTNFAIYHHLIDGIRLPNGKILYDSFGPGRNISRGEMSKLAVKAIELKSEQE